jgi:molybdate transport system substrate-binding protein
MITASGYFKRALLKISLSRVNIRCKVYSIKIRRLWGGCQGGIIVYIIYSDRLEPIYLLGFNMRFGGPFIMCRIPFSLSCFKYKWLVMLLFSSSIAAEQVVVAVAANFMIPMKTLAAEFENNTEHQVKLVSGSSGRFFAQIYHGAPFDLFLSADREKPQQLIDLGLALPSSLFTYATGRLVLWGVNKQEITSKTLSTVDFNHLAIANAKLAPYGQAAKEVLVQLGLEQETRSKWVVGENISQTYQFVASKNADYGFIAASQWQGQGSAWLVPANLHQPIQQDAVILTSAKDNRAVFDLVEYLQSPAAAVIIQDYGYQVQSSVSHCCINDERE